MNAVSRSAECRPIKNLTKNESVGRDSVEPIGEWCFDTNLAPSKTSEIARGRLLSIRGEPLFYATWDRAIFIHYETDPPIRRNCSAAFRTISISTKDAPLSASLHSRCVECGHDLAAESASCF